ncbi:MAG: TRAM domain-containing protein [Treponema sp.]|jgi:23S rRNA (uracil1939-C5)-methyltransferase|nr:TRAM domain-containing protein [Treponema sp.]
MSVGDVIKIRFESIAKSGDAVGRFDGKTVFAEGGAPDEIAICRITEDKKTWLRAELLEIIESSPVRTEPPCAFYGKCGGCNLQHINYDAQLDVKISILKESFFRAGAVSESYTISIPEPKIFSSPPWEYRNRMQFHCLRQKAKGNNYSFGLKGKKSGEVVIINDCPIAVPDIRKALNSSSFRVPPEKDRFTVFAKDGIFLNEGGDERGKIKILDKEIIIDSGVFFQSNCIMLEKLVPQLREIAMKADRNLPMADLYCGVGTFAFFLADLFPSVILAEENKIAVGIAGENLRNYKTEFFALRDTEWQRVLLHKKASYGFAVIDPPRAGLSSGAATALSKNGPDVLAYVSCDAASLARDSKILVNSGYKLNQLMFFDFYPQTAHIESLAVFIR